MTPHATVAQMVRDTFILAPEDGMRAFLGPSVVLRARLSPEERRGLAWSALMACDDEEAAAISEAVLPPPTRAGWPMVPLEDVVSEAAFWADLASREELRAYAFVCLSRLPEGDRMALITPAKRRAA